MHLLRKCVASLSLLTVAATLAVTPTQAKPIQYVFSGAISGSLNGVSFTNSNITFTALGDTANIVMPPPFQGVDYLINPTGHPMFTLDGFGSGSLTDPYHIFALQDAVIRGVGLTQSIPGGNNSDIFDVGTTPSFAYYDLATSFGPVSGKSGGPTGKAFGTTLGDLKFTEFGQGTFAANTAPPVPEASTTASLGLLLALGGLVVAAKRKKASA